MKISGGFGKWYGNGKSASYKTDHMVGYTIGTRHAVLEFMEEASRTMRDYGLKVVFNHTRIKEENEYSIYYCRSLEQQSNGFGILTFFDDEKWMEARDFEFTFPYPEDEGKRIILAGNRSRTEQNIALNRELEYFKEYGLLRGDVWTKSINDVSGKVYEILADSFFPMNKIITF